MPTAQENKKNFTLLMQTLASQSRGYCDSQELLQNFFDDYNIDGYMIAKQNGFNNFEELLSSRLLRNYVVPFISEDGKTVYKAPFDSRFQHIVGEIAESNRIKEAKNSRVVQPSTKNQNSMHNSNQRQNGGMDKTGFLPYNNSAWNDLDNDFDVNAFKAFSQQSRMPPVNRAQSSSQAKRTAINWSDGEEVEDEIGDIPVLSANSGAATGSKKFQGDISKTKQQYTTKGDGEYTDYDQSEDDDDDETPTPSVTKLTSNAVGKGSASTSRTVPILAQQKIQPDISTSGMFVNDEVRDRLSQLRERTTNDNVANNHVATGKPNGMPHGAKWLFELSQQQKEKSNGTAAQLKTKEDRKNVFGNISFAEYRNLKPTMDFLNAGVLSKVKPEQACNGENPIPSETVSSAIPRGATMRGVDHPLRRTESICSVVSTLAARRNNRNLTEDDLAKVGNVVTSIVKYYYPRTILLDDLLQAMELIEPRFSHMEDVSSWDYGGFFKKYCPEITVVGKVGKQNLLWDEQ